MLAHDLLLLKEVEQFLFDEAALIDDRRFNEWLELLDDEFRVYMPISRNVRYDQEAAAVTRERQDMSWFDEGKDTISQRISQIATGLHWAEEPRSRTTHLITNVRVDEVQPSVAAAERVTVRCSFMVYRNRGQTETDHLVGRRIDQLRKKDGAWRVLRREVHLAQTVLLAKNLTTFF
jgi:3-phenylpropionate/cinnamic acid dioxygenase small subunit